MSTLDNKLRASMEVNYKLSAILKLTLKDDRLLSRKLINIRTRPTVCSSKMLYINLKTDALSTRQDLR